MGLSNLPDEIWSRLKMWAQFQGQAAESTTLDECTASVRSICRNLTGRSDSLHDEVVDFYAAEALDMVDRWRATQAARAADHRALDGDAGIQAAV